MKHLFHRSLILVYKVKHLKICLDGVRTCAYIHTLYDDDKSVSVNDDLSFLGISQSDVSIDNFMKKLLHYKISSD